MSVVSQLEVVVGGDVGNLQSSLRGADQQVEGFASRVSNKMKKVGKSLTVGVTLPLIGVGVAAAKMAIDWESQFAGVRKTVSGTEEELAALEKGLRNLATASDSPVAGLANSHEELAGIAEIAGQLGVETDNILGFTETIAQLGMATNLSGEAAALALAQFANVTGMDMGEIDRLGATIVDLGNNMATTEADIVGFATRLAGAGTMAGLSEADILALGGAMASVGLQAEAGGTAMTTVLNEMATAVGSFSTGTVDAAQATTRAEDDLVDAIGGRASAVRKLEGAYGKLENAASDAERQAAQIEVNRLTADIQKYDTQIGNSQENITKWGDAQTVTFTNASDELRLFAETAGISVDEFAELWETDADQALVKFIEGLGELDQAAQLDVLDDLNMSGIRVQDTLRRLAGDSDILREALERAGIAWDDGTALTAEAQTRFETTSAQLSLFGNNLRDVGITIGSIFLPMINDAIGLVVPLLQEISNMNPDVLQMGVAFLGAAAAAGPLIFAVGALLSPVGLVAGAFAVAAIGVPLFVDKLREVFPAFDEFVTNAQQFLTDIGGIGGIASALSLAITGDLNGFGILDLEITMRIMTFRTNLIGKVNELLGDAAAIGGKISGVGEAFVSGIVQSFETATGAVDFSATLQPIRDSLDSALSSLFGGGGGAATMASPGGGGGGIADSLATSISSSFSGVVIDTTAITTWATDNVNTILETVATVAGMVVGGPVGLAIGAGKLVATAIENDFLGVGTFLTESGIKASVEQGLKDVKIAIESVISNIFGGEGGGVDVSAMTDIGSSIKDGWDTYVQPIVDAVSDVVTQDIGPGLTDLGSGIGEFITNLGAADFSGLSAGVGSLSSLVSIIIRLGGALAGGLLSGIGDSLPEIGTGLASLISAVSAAGEGDWGSALSLAGEGLASIGSGLLQIPAGIADSAIEEIEKLTGVELPSVDEGMAAWVGAFETAGQTIAIVMDNIKRGVERILLDIGIALTQAALDMANNPLIQLTPQAGMINQMIVPAEAGLAAAQGQRANMDVADTFTEDLVAAKKGSDIDLAGFLMPEDTSGVAAVLSERGKQALQDMMTLLTAEEDWTNLGLVLPMAEALDFDTEGLTEMINTKLDEAIMLGDEEAFNALIPTAAELDIPLDMLQIQMDESLADAAAAQDYEAEATVLLSIDVDVVNMDAVKSAVSGAMKAVGAGVTGVSNPNPAVHHTGGTFYHPSGEGLAFLKSGETIRTEAQEQALRRSKGSGARGGGDTYIVNSYGQSAYGLVTEVERARRDMG